MPRWTGRKNLIAHDNIREGESKLPFFLPTLKLYMNSNASLKKATATLCDRVFAIIITPFCSYILKLWYLFQFAKWHNCQNPWCTSVWLVYYFILGTPANNHKENSYTRKMFEYIKRSAYTLFAINPLWFGKKFKSGSKRFCYFWMQDKNNVVHTCFWVNCGMVYCQYCSLGITQLCISPK